MSRLIEIDDPASCPVPLQIRAGDVLMFKASGALLRSGEDAVSVLGSFTTALVTGSGVIFGSITSDMAPALIDRYDLLRGVKKLGTWWEWSELFFGNGFDLAMHRRDCTDAVWAATLAANKGPGQWYADADSLRYSFFDKVESDD